MDLRINNESANLRVAPNTQKAPLFRLPAGHLIITTGPAQNNWQPCQTQINGGTFGGFVHSSLLRPPIDPEVDRLIEAVGVEYRAFRFGERHETRPDSMARIADYWRALGMQPQPISTAWSAAFISFVMRQAALTRSFRFSQRHTTYFSDSKTAFLNADASRAYWAVRLADRVLQVGDLVGYSRIGGDCGTTHHDYDDLPGDFCSHSDVVVSIRGGVATTIGGNVGNTVKVKDVPLTAAGRVAVGNRRILTMARNF
jgi:Uncharacterized protein conserved in bacteria (DUF2272)